MLLAIVEAHPFTGNFCDAVDIPGPLRMVFRKQVRKLFAKRRGGSRKEKFANPVLEAKLVELEARSGINLPSGVSISLRAAGQKRREMDDGIWRTFRKKRIQKIAISDVGNVIGDARDRFAINRIGDVGTDDFVPLLDKFLYEQFREIAVSAGNENRIHASEIYNNWEFDILCQLFSD